MLPKEEIANPNKINQLVYESLRFSKTREMTIFETDMFVKLFKANKQNPEIPEKEKPWLLKVIEARFKAFGTIEVTDSRVYVMLMTICKNPVQSSIYFWFIQAWCFHNKVRVLNFKVLTESIFPMGFFTDEQLTKVWDSQKTEDGKNVLDFASAGESIEFKEQETVANGN